MKKQNVNPERELLFHFTKFDTAFFHILPNNHLRLNPVAFMNDIYETDNRLNDFWNSTSMELRGYGNFEYLKENKVKILCFVNDGPTRGFDNQLMWSFYGDKYEGACLVFDKKKLIDLFENEFGELGEKGLVRYELKTPRKINETENFNFDGVKGKEWDKRNMIYDSNSNKFWEILKKEERYLDLFFRKNKQWSGENEFRFLVFDDTNPVIDTFKTEDLFFQYKDALIGVILGPKFNDIDRQTALEKLGRNNGFKICKSRYKGNKIIPLNINVLDCQKEIDYKIAFKILEDL